MQKIVRDKLLTDLNILKTEHYEAVNLAEYLGILQAQGRIDLFTHVSNETYTKSWKQKRKNKLEGVKSGVPDYIVVTPSEVLFIELKRVKNGRPTPQQTEWLLKLKGKRTDTTLAKGFEEAKSYIESRLRWE